MSVEERRLLVVVAHPDDESFGMAGLIARYTRENAGVYLICATNGDVGTVDPQFMEGYNSVAERRLAELDCAARTLGFARVFTFGYRDSGMAGSPDNHHPDALVTASLDEVTARVVAVIREVRPQVVITFDPYGGYGHPDHIRIHEAAVAAFHAAGDPAYHSEWIDETLPPYSPQKLYFSVFNRGWLKPIVRLMPLFGQDPSRFGRNHDIDLRAIAAQQFPIHARVRTRAYEEIARQARDCHASQLPLQGTSQRLSLLNLYQRLWNWLSPAEHTFMRAYPPVNGGHHQVERDLFQGVDLSR
ncbi:MAG: PIG-L family deacetylase [Anaerolineae bacterium]